MSLNDAIQRALQLYREGTFYPVYDTEQHAITWHEAGDGGEEDALPSNQVLPAIAVQARIDEGANVTWRSDQQDELHVVLPNITIPLAQLGHHRIYGFFDKRQHPDWRDTCEDADPSA